MATILATNLTAAGLQVIATLGQVGDTFSEDCLTLNVWTKPQVGDTKKAVLVWIYGGGFSTGTANGAAYNGQYFADQEDVVLVTFNYRLNIFGFPGAPDTTQNLGLLDQRMAVEWVRDNIAAFGGDPLRITLFGQSAGSASVDYYSYAWTQDPIAHGFIEESGSALGPAPGLGPTSAADAAAFWFTATMTLGCGNSTSDSAATLACMKSKSDQELLKAFLVTTTGGASPIASSFGPTVDGTVVFSDYTNRSIAGNFSRLPLLTGTTDYEAGLFKVLDAFQNVTQSDAYWNLFDQIVFTCPCSGRANASIAQNVPTWRYRWFGVFGNTQLTTFPLSGAWHASELAPLFGNLPAGSGIPNSTAAELAISSYIRGAWATFAKNPTSGLTTYQDGWPKYIPDQPTLARLGYQNLSGVNLAIGNTYDVGCSLTVPGTSGRNMSATNTSAPASSVTPSGTALATVTSSGAWSILGIKSWASLVLGIAVGFVIV